jgi:hypothetical protein
MGMNTSTLSVGLDMDLKMILGKCVVMSWRVQRTWSKSMKREVSPFLHHLSTKLREGARTDISEQPITILDRDKNGRYLVSFCGSARSKDYSPLAEKEWMKPIDVSINRIPQPSVKRAIREWEVSQIPTPPRTPLSCSESSTNSRAGGASTAPDGWKRYTGKYIQLLFASRLKLIR